MERFTLLSMVLLAFACSNQLDRSSAEKLHPVPLGSQPVLPPQDSPSECAQDGPIAGGLEAPDDDGGPDSGAPEFSITADPATITLPQGASLGIAVTISRPAGFAETVAVTVDGLPEGVSASTLAFAPDEDTGTITLTSAPNAGIPTPNLARLRGHGSTGTRSVALAVSVRGAASSADPSFGHDGLVLAMTTMMDVKEDATGKILFTGQPNDADVPSICRLEINGDPDNTFGTFAGCTRLDSEHATGQRLAIQGDKILLLGASYDTGLFVARFSKDGEPDVTFGTNGLTEIETEGYFRGAAIKVIGQKIVVAGTIDLGWAGGDRLIARLDENGGVETSFQPELRGPVNMIGDLVALDGCGFAVSTRDTLQAFKADGSRDLGFGTDGSVSLPQLSWGLTRAADGDILSAGDGMAVVRISPAGLLEGSTPPLSPGLSDIGWAQHPNAFRIALDDDGDMVLAGTVSSNENWMGIGRRLKTGEPDLAFGSGGVRTYDIVGSGHSIVILRDGRYVLAGTTNGGDGALLRIWN